MVQVISIYNDSQGNASGRMCHTTGKYQCTEHDDTTIYIVRGERFPFCGKGRHAANWTLTDTLSKRLREIAQGGIESGSKPRSD